jgi:hypothetical protein
MSSRKRLGFAELKCPMPTRLRTFVYSLSLFQSGHLLRLFCNAKAASIAAIERLGMESRRCVMDTGLPMAPSAAHAPSSVVQRSKRLASNHSGSLVPAGQCRLYRNLPVARSINSHSLCVPCGTDSCTRKAFLLSRKTLMGQERARPFSKMFPMDKAAARSVMPIPETHLRRAV